MTARTFDSLMGISWLLASQEIPCTFLTVGGEAAITRGRSNIVTTFDSTDFETLAMIDADIEIDPLDFLKLLKLDKPIRGAAVCLKTEDHSERLNAFIGKHRVTRAEMPQEPFEVDLLGGAVMLIDRSVIEDLMEEEDLAYTDPVYGQGVHMFHEIIRDATLLTEDYAFCTRAKEAGHSIWVDPSVIVGHYGPSCWRH